MKKVRKLSPRQPKPATTALTIIQATEKPLSKNQQEFNRLTARIEKLRKDVDRRQQQFDEALSLYSKEVVPLEEGLSQQSEQLLKLLFPVYQKKQLPSTLQPHLKDMLRNLLQNVLLNLPGKPSDELKEMFRHLEGERYETVRKREEKIMKEEMEDMFGMWGMDVDMKDTKLNDESFAEKMAELQEQMKAKMAEEQKRWEEQQKTRRKTARQIEKEKARTTAEELKQKSISTIYRQLAKLLHPDLEQDETRRAEKEALMQEVIKAYEARDLHTLLLLELKWIHQEQNHLESVADEKLALYLQVLREQARNLEQEKFHLINHPRYHVLLTRYGYTPLSYPEKAIKEDLRHLTDLRKTYQMDISRLQKPNPVPYIKTMVNQWKLKSEFEKDESDFLATLMSLSGR